VAKDLAKIGDPLIAPNGDVLVEEDDDDLSPSHLLPPATAVPFKDYRPITRRVLTELRAPADMLNVTSVVLFYTLLGISDTEISDATKLTGEQIEHIRNSRTYADMFDNIMRELINANSEYIECRISAYSGMALGNIAEIAARTRNTGYRLAASKDLLDRAGHRPQDNASRQNSGMNELHIIITEPNDADNIKLDLTIRRNGYNGGSNGHGN
jgi:hypothetical protein